MNDGTAIRELTSPIDLTGSNPEMKLTGSFASLVQAFDQQNTVYPRWKTVVGQSKPKSLVQKETKSFKLGKVLAAVCGSIF